MKAYRTYLWVGKTLAALALSSAVAAAQSDSITPSQRKIDEQRVERLRRDVQAESAAATAAEERAIALMMSRETFALRQLDSVMTVSEDALLAQRARLQTLANAVRRPAGAVLVVEFRADSASPGQRVDSLGLRVDNGVAAGRRYSAYANSALANGAVDELYRSTVVPAPHQVAVTALVGGQPRTASVRVETQAGGTTYVQFAMRNGQVTQTTWTSRDVAP